MATEFIEALRRSLPPTFSRQVAADNLRGIFSVGGLANLDSRGEGPGAVRIGRVVGYGGNRSFRGSWAVWKQKASIP